MLSHLIRLESPGLSRRVFSVVTALMIALLVGRSASAEPGPRLPGFCDSRACVVVEHEPVLAAEAQALVEALRLRLSKHGVSVGLGSTPEEPPVAEAGEDRAAAESAATVLWVIHLRELSSELVLVAVDNLSTVDGDDLVREARRSDSAKATAWTLALMVEETILPYVEKSGEQAPLGAGLAIIEPAVVGGTKKDGGSGDEQQPKLRFISMALAVYRLAQADDFIAGPRASLEGAFARSLVASIGTGWVGWAEFSAHGIGGSTSLIPLDVMFGFVFLPGRVVELTASAGFSVGFSIFRAARDNRFITEVLFDPLGQVSLRAIFHVFGPWALFVDGGAAFVFVRDVLKDAGRTIYRQDWVMPFFNVGLQFWFL
jgi:hypothetical protein